MEEGTVDVRTRDNKRHGRWRLDDLLEHFNSLMPGESMNSKKLYEKAYNPADYPRVEKPQTGPKDEKLAKYEKILAKSQFIGGNAPSTLDKEALDDLKDNVIDSEECPNLYGWFTHV